MRALLLVLATVSGLAVAAPTLAKTYNVNSKLTIDDTGFSGDPKVLSDAVTNIEFLNGGRVAAIAFNNVDGTPGYGAIVLKGSEVRFWRLDKPKGKPVELTGASVPSWMLNWKEQRRATVVKESKVSLADAIRTAVAEQHGSPAVVAGIARSAANGSADIHAYMVGILRNGRLVRVGVDTTTGSPIANLAALEW